MMGRNTHTLAPLLSKQVATPVLLAELDSPSQGAQIGPAKLLRPRQSDWRAILAPASHAMSATVQSLSSASALVPGEARVRPLRLSRGPLETAVRTDDGFSQEEKLPNRIHRIRPDLAL